MNKFFYIFSPILIVCACIGCDQNSAVKTGSKAKSLASPNQDHLKSIEGSATYSLDLDIESDLSALEAGRELELALNMPVPLGINPTGGYIKVGDVEGKRSGFLYSNYNLDPETANNFAGLAFQKWHEIKGEVKGSFLEQKTYTGDRDLDIYGTRLAKGTITILHRVPNAQNPVEYLLWVDPSTQQAVLSRHWGYVP